MRKVEAQMIQAVRDFVNGSDLISGKSHKRFGNTEVQSHHHGIRGTHSYQHTITVWLHNNLIATVYPSCGRMICRDAGWPTTTTKSRLNALLGAFNDGAGIYQKAFEWYASGAIGATEDGWDGSDEFKFSVADRWQLKTAEAIAG
ncbi:hypothetical protein HOQ56_gp41 [uncultured phage_MedDCM-OCT-S38-C3]|uniref:Uncharacterized protein n=1 Tax=uncultured phage_MedDCM-OCT-S38-C3 TaxID=2740803 RepID=A0A6S4PIW7_9CAUD|nr:hypothetical protein HOQ56_gp41 [uncultured phage_MedDCM-OCT-S38-C3]BAQ94466.1 hypothetical protein [uncultured phage_MedDCM-OCT-S38-C3]